MNSSVIRVQYGIDYRLVELTSPKLRGRELDRAVDKEIGESSSTIVDISTVTTLDSRGLAMILGWIRRAERSGARMILCGLSRETRLVIELVQLQDLVEVFNRPSEAIRSLSANAVAESRRGDGRPGAKTVVSESASHAFENGEDLVSA